MSQGDGVKGPFFSDLEIDFAFRFDIKYSIRRYKKRRYIALVHHLADDLLEEKWEL